MIELKDASIEVCGRSVISNLSLLAYDGKLTCVCGASGSGKTLLLRAFMGFVPLSGGYLSIDGELVSALSLPVFRKMMVWLPDGLHRYGGSPVFRDSSGWAVEEYGVWNSVVPEPVVVEPQCDLEPSAVTALIERCLLSAGKHIVVADCPADDLPADDSERVMRMLREQTAAGLTVVMSTRSAAIASATDVCYEL